MVEHTRRVLDREIIKLEIAAMDLIEKANAYLHEQNLGPTEEVTLQIIMIQDSIKALRKMVDPGIWTCRISRS